MTDEFDVPVVAPVKVPQPDEQAVPFCMSCHVTAWLPVPPVTVAVNVWVPLTGTLA